MFFMLFLYSTDGGPAAPAADDGWRGGDPGTVPDQQH